MSSKLVVLATAVGCIGAAGFGAYLAVKSAPAGQAAPLTEAAVPAAQASALQGDGAPPKTALPPSPGRRPTAPMTQPSPRPGTEPVSTRAVLSNPPAAAPQDNQTPQETPAEEPTTREVPVENVAVSAGQPGPAVSSPAALEDVLVTADAVLGIRIETPVSSATSKVEDRVTGHLTRDVTVDGRTVIPAGTEVTGHVSLIERGGRVRERARLGVKFTSILLDDRIRIPIQTDAVFREGEPPANEATAKIGASAVIGGIIGGVFGGKRGAAIGGAAGAAGGTAVVMAGGRNDATLPAGSTVTIRLSAPVTVQVERR